MSIEPSIERVHLLNKETLIVSDINIDFREKLGYGKHRLAKGLRNLHSKQLVDFITRVIRVTIIQFQCYRFCLESLSAMCTIRYTLFSAIITCFFKSVRFSKKPQN